MQWLQDKKNLPYVIGGGALIVVIAVVLFFVLKGGGNSGASDMSAEAPQTAQMDGAVQPGMPGAEQPMPMPGGPAPAYPDPSAGMPGMPGMPGMDTGAGAQAVDIAEADDPIELWKSDPFSPDIEPKAKKVKIVKRIDDLPMALPGLIFPPAPPKNPVGTDDWPAPQPPRRLAGIMHGDRVSALIQTSASNFEVVRPGQRLSDGSAVVERIERDRVVLRTTDSRPSRFDLKLAASVVQLESPAGGVSGGGLPGAGSVPGMPMPGGRRTSSSFATDGRPM